MYKVELKVDCQKFFSFPFFSNLLTEVFVRRTKVSEFFRRCIPGFSLFQDDVLATYYLNQLKIFLYQEGDSQANAIVRLSQERINRCLQRNFIFPWARKKLFELERYVLAINMKTNALISAQEIEAQKVVCRQHSHSLLSQWRSLNLPEEVFWTTPDLVDFIRFSFLKKAFQFPFYKNDLEMQSIFNVKGESRREAHLRVEGTMRPWKEVRHRLFLDRKGAIYSLNTQEEKIYWWYLNKGLMPWNKRHWQTPEPLTILKTPPLQCQVQLITSHAKKRDWFPLLDNYLEGVRHFFIRVVFRQQFEKAHPHAFFKEGEVYSFGYVPNPKDFCISSPLATIRGHMMSPDYCELHSEDLCITPVSISDEKALKLMQKIIQFTRDQTPFHFINENCANVFQSFLKELEIIHFSTDVHFLTIWYRIFIPERMRAFIDKARACFAKIIPSYVLVVLNNIRDITHSLILTPLVLMFGGLKVNIDPKDPFHLKLTKGFTSFFPKYTDLFNPNKMILQTPRKIYEMYQKIHPKTYFEYHSILE